MSNKRITDLTELTTPTTDDVFPVVDIATNTTQKVQLANLPVQTAVTTALATKQDTLVSGTNIKTVNSTSLVGSGNVAVQPTLVSGTSIKTVNSNSLLGSGDVAVQATLVSGVSIKTVNSTSLLGSGDIPIPIVTPSGVSGAIQFSNGSAFASDAANLFWDDTNNRLGVGTNTPIAGILHVKTTTANTNSSIIFGNNATATILAATDTGSALTQLQFRASSYNFTDTAGMRIASNGYGTVVTAMLQVVGSGSTSATTSLLVQNSAGSTSIQAFDDRTVNLGGNSVLRLRNNDSIQMFATNGYEVHIGNGSTNYLSVTSAGTHIKTGSGAPVASAILDVDSTTKGFLPPRMTTTQKNAIATPAAGLVVYDSTTNKLQCYNGSTWNDLF